MIFQRLSAESAATILQLYLWAPSSWIKDENAQLPSSNEVMIIFLLWFSLAM